MTESLEQQQQELTIPSEEEFVEKVRGMEQERARRSYRIQEQTEEIAAKEREIESMQVWLGFHYKKSGVFVDIKLWLYFF